MGTHAGINEAQRFAVHPMARIFQAEMSAQRDTTEAASPDPWE